MSFQQPQHCFSCKRKLSQTHVCVPDGEDLYDHFIARAVWVSPRDREISFCNRCYDLRLFAGLHPDEVAALHWSFGRCESEDSPELIEKKIKRLLLAAE